MSGLTDAHITEAGCRRASESIDGLVDSTTAAMQVREVVWNVKRGRPHPRSCCCRCRQPEEAPWRSGTVFVDAASPRHDHRCGVMNIWQVIVLAVVFIVAVGMFVLAMCHAARLGDRWPRP